MGEIQNMYLYTLTFIVALISVLTPYIPAKYAGIATTVALLLAYRIHLNKFKPLLAIGAGAMVWAISKYSDYNRLEMARNVTGVYLIAMLIPYMTHM